MSAQGCERFFLQLDRIIEHAGVRDTEQAQIQGFPYLRADRFLASFRTDVKSDAEFNAWMARLRSLDQTAREKELANLQPQALPQPQGANYDNDQLNATIAKCGALLSERDLSDPLKCDNLRQNARVPPAYQTYKRVLGLYPITAQGVLWGVERLHKETALNFATPKQDLPIQGELLRYSPPSTAKRLNRRQVAQFIKASSANSLRIPEPGAEDKQRLFDTFAPVWEIDVASDNDRIGAPRWSAARKPKVDIERPRVYQRISHTRFNGQILLQLNYQIWFPSRPRSGTFDLLGGRLDGILWRVTLAPNGEPMLFDSIHNCGCYHLFFPSPGLIYRGRAYVYDEPLLIAHSLPALNEGERIVVRIAPSTHYLQNLSTVETQRPSRVVEYSLEDYDTLRSLPLASGAHRSLFGTDGLVAGTERGERWIFWPMGIPDPGAMRQWGHHATAFVGRRHFDDPDLLDRYFEVQE